MAYYGNLALRPERVQEEKVQPARPPQRKQEPQRKQSPQQRSIPIGEKLLYLLTIGLVVFVAGFIIFRYAQIYQINGEIQATKKNYEQVIEQNKEQQREVERLNDPNRIQEVAIKELGMVKVGAGITASKDDQNAMAKKR
ncbi:cell division protein FtsL [Cohnella herbarum]|uniref:Cell division protein FtsL n=1 Tax=Cohnella herbarum TaxID=2728023 RepID=A0A7Z2VIR5_9BACL|nr:cell division protein FtsL [Cohnella herbarum]QJD83595.1 cell division protein FtsL [Cohnella herbarum]